MINSSYCMILWWLLINPCSQFLLYNCITLQLHQIVISFLMHRGLGGSSTWLIVTLVTFANVSWQVSWLLHWPWSPLPKQMPSDPAPHDLFDPSCLMLPQIKRIKIMIFVSLMLISGWPSSLYLERVCGFHEDAAAPHARPFEPRIVATTHLHPSPCHTLSKSYKMKIICMSAILLYLIFLGRNAFWRAFTARECVHERRAGAVHDGLPQGGSRGRCSFYFDLEESHECSSNGQSQSHRTSFRLNGPSDATYQAWKIYCSDRLDS